MVIRKGLHSLPLLGTVVKQLSCKYDSTVHQPTSQLWGRFTLNRLWSCKQRVPGKKEGGQEIGLALAVSDSEIRFSILFILFGDS